MSNLSTIPMDGCGSMESVMALLFAEVRVHVSLSDSLDEAMDAVIDKANQSDYNGKVQKYNRKYQQTPRSRLFLNY
ncbi:hypothetical protein DE146DRAFT_398053 [Phaeosphaeria sp. MPI-PUGE-AT-0046c]|nr:hypothetical protein DE146DRAFT_398053 [Phaeosphaeria sp. MPI-PUGE-AT-0046c]